MLVVRSATIQDSKLLYYRLVLAVFGAIVSSRMTMFLRQSRRNDSFFAVVPFEASVLPEVSKSAIRLESVRVVSLGFCDRRTVTGNDARVQLEFKCRDNLSEDYKLRVLVSL